MAIEFGSKFIWQHNSPAPFESAWSIFAKLMALNGYNPYLIASAIAAVEFVPSRRSSLKFRSSSWINFEIFSGLLDVKQYRLYAAFLDQLGFNIKEDCQPYSNGVKVCMECLKKGYHCVFFELGFVDICPWHNKKLEIPCSHCLNTVLNTGLIRKEQTLDSTSKHTDWTEWHSRCDHINFNEGQVRIMNQLTLIEEEVIAKSCAELLNWWKNVSKNSGVSNFLARYAFNEADSELVTKFFNAAENIAGPCPWPVDRIKQPIRGQSWTQSSPEMYFDGYRAPRKSEWDIIYRSIRRHIFNKYVRRHRACWNELKNYSHTESQCLDSNNVCSVALAYASWRLASELFVNIEALKIDRLKSNPVLVMRLSEPNFLTSLIAHASLLYVQFFYIWDEIIKFAGKDSFTIDHELVGWYTHYFAATFVPEINNACGDRYSGEWTIIFPDYKSLENISFINCCGRLKGEGWMIYSHGFVHPYFLAASASSGNSLFKLKKYEGEHRRASYHSIGI